MKHTISALVENQPGVLARIIGLISGRGYNIHSLNVAPTHDSATSRLTMVVPGDDRVIEQVTKQLNKLVDVIKVLDLTDEKYLDRELALIKVQSTAKNRSAIMEIATLYRAEIARVQTRTLTIQLVGTSEDVDNLIELLKPHGIVDVCRSGVVALGRGE